MMEYCPRCDEETEHEKLDSDQHRCTRCGIRSNSSIPDDEWINFYDVPLTNEEIKNVYYDSLNEEPHNKPDCPRCRSADVMLIGTNSDGVERYVCNICQRRFLYG